VHAHHKFLKILCACTYFYHKFLKIDIYPCMLSFCVHISVSVLQSITCRHTYICSMAPWSQFQAIAQSFHRSGCVRIKKKYKFRLSPMHKVVQKSCCSSLYKPMLRLGAYLQRSLMKDFMQIYRGISLYKILWTIICGTT